MCNSCITLRAWERNESITCEGLPSRKTRGYERHERSATSCSPAPSCPEGVSVLRSSCPLLAWAPSKVPPGPETLTRGSILDREETLPGTPPGTIEIDPLQHGPCWSRHGKCIEHSWGNSSSMLQSMVHWPGKLQGNEIMDCSVTSGDTWARAPPAEIQMFRARSVDLSILD